ncbi:MFS transporter [Salinibacterium hongtaonis]|uniref:MFS transporter n=1 Tax=Homoserinimonas hongtaonis TaxID=2079791 RepID=A0A2U1T231_9MICO|nr:MFS transporter [Salinibacterium hongtaonis]PWB97941.1 MFS transporter [Salinibacterium hongtaonis]
MKSMFRSLSIYNYRLWFAGALVSNIGTWMQRTAQDWIVLTDLTDHDAAALGVTMALQFGPALVLTPITGLIADRVDKRRMLMLTQVLLGVLGLGLGLIVVLGVAQLWQVYAFALALGVVSAFDAPSRQAFVSELVGEKDLTNAVGLNSLSFHSARLVGPAVAGILVALIGAGWVFLINAASFIAVFVSLTQMRRNELTPSRPAPRTKGQIRDGYRYVRGRPDIVVTLVMVFLVGTFGFNFAIFISTMATVEFGQGAGEFGLLSSLMAVGAVAGSLIAARRERPRLRIVTAAAAAFGVACMIAAVMPNYVSFAAALVLVGLSSLTMMTSANAYVQTTTPPELRGRVMALYLAIFMGGTPLGAPVTGWITNELGPRWGLGLAAISGLLAAAIALWWMIRHRGLRLRFYRGERRVRMEYLGDGRAVVKDEVSPDAATREIAVVEANNQKS